ncbi:undecaprenyl-phosphate glucose phosphotransferase [Chlorobaculum sp. 24CR]|nr:undecaprenyl-phosphate glucose phosphotransferase [Chlorobaculum sp. 24CR]
MLEIRQYRSQFILVKRIVDAVMPICVLYAVTNIYGIAWSDRYILLGFVEGFIFMLSCQFFGAYENWRARSIQESFQITLKSWIVSVIFLIVVGFILKRSYEYSRFVIGLWSIASLVLLSVFRVLSWMFMHYAFRTGMYTKKVAIAGIGKVGKYLIELFNENPSLGYKVVGVYDDDLDRKITMNKMYEAHGNLDDLCVDACEPIFDELYLCLPIGAESRIVSIMNKLSQTTVVVKYVPDLFAFELLHAKWHDLKGLPIISVYDTPMSSFSARMLKRIEDLMVSILIMLLIWPIMLLIALGVKLSSPGPIFYRQNRIGWNGKSFSILKFRSMPVDIENKKVEWGNASRKTTTKFGQFIRATSLDELPQFFNVLKGDMSIVGPRPERDIFIKKISKEVPRYMQRHMVKAGITGWAQVHGLRGDTCLNKRVKYDLYYINNWTLLLDIKIILSTLFKMSAKD